MARKLDTTVKKNGFVYNLIERTEHKALYEQRDKKGILHGHELFKVKIVKAGIMFGKEITPYEKFPSNSDFGITAWSVGINVDEAIRKYHKL